MNMSLYMIDKQHFNNQKLLFYNKNREYYDRSFSTYENSSWYYFNSYKNNKVIEELILCLNNLDKDNSIKILEIGPGTGYLLEKLLLLLDRKKVHYEGIEHSKNMVKVLENKFHDKFSSFKLTNESMTNELLLGKVFLNNYDLIIGSSILHHLLDYRDIIPTLAQRLKINGIMYFVREPIHVEECCSSGFIKNSLEVIYHFVNSIFMYEFIRKKLWPQKIKAEKVTDIAYYMFKDGVSVKPFLKLINENNFKLITYRKYNRRLTGLLSYLENEWLNRLRKDVAGETLFSIAIQKTEE